MEDALQRLMKESGSTKYASIANSSHRALDILEAYALAPAFEYRHNALEAVRHALSIGSPKIISLAIAVLQRMIRDDRFHSKEPEQEDQHWMSTQVVAAVSAADSLAEDQKQEVLKILLSLSCHVGWTLNGRLVIQILTLCLGLYSTSGNGTKAAAQATCSQTIAEYSKDLNSSAVEDAQERFNDAIPVFQFLTSRLDDLTKNSENSSSELPLLLQCLQSLVVCIPSAISGNAHFKRFVCSKLSPTLIAYLEVADDTVSTRLQRFWQKRRQKQSAHSTSSAVAVTTAATDCRLSEQNVIVLTAVVAGVATLLGPQADMRPVVESIFHRMLICSQQKTRLLALQNLKELLKDPAKVLLLALYDEVPDDMEYDSMPLFKLIADCLEECSRMDDNPKLMYEATQCISSLLHSLERISQGSELSEVQTQNILAAFRKLEDSDYTGPTSYDGTSRLPESYHAALSKKQAEAERHQDGEKCQQLEPGHEEDGASKGEDGDESDDKRSESEGGGCEEEKLDTTTASGESKEKVEVDDDIKVPGPQEGNDGQGKEDGHKDDGSSTDGGVQRVNGEVDKDSGAENAELVESDSSKPDGEVEKVSEDSDAGSEATEGPEEGFDEDQANLKLDAYVDEANNLEMEAAIFHNSRIPRSLVGSQMAARLSQDDEDLSEAEDDNEMRASERRNARAFVLKLKENLESISNARGSVEMDHRLQQFASNFCNNHSTQSPEVESSHLVILNADGVYLTAYRALHLSMRYMENPSSLISKEAFVDSVLNSGLLVYVSPVWLSEVYEAITELDAFELCLRDKTRLGGMRSLLTDLEGFGETHRGAQMLSDFRRKHDVVRSDSLDENASLRIDAGKRLSRRILTTCWSSFLSHLLTTFGPFLANSDRSGVGGRGSLSGLFRAPPSSRIFSDERLTVGVDCLQTAVSLCSTLELHDRCGEMLEPLTGFVCPEDGGDTSNIKKKKSRGVGKSGSATRYNLAHLMCIEDVLKNGFELASQSQDCWKYIMRCVTYMIRMESERADRKVIPKKPAQPKKQVEKESDDLDLNFDDLMAQEEPISQSSFSLPPGFNVEDKSKGLDDCFPHYVGVKDKATLLTPDEASTATAVLAQCVEKLFDDAATKLNLQSLMGFMSELTFCSHKQLLTIFPRKAQSTKLNSAVSLATANSTLLFHRISEVMLKCVKSGRPLLHIIRAWSVVGPHLMEASCHREDLIAKKAIEYIHDVITVFLQNTVELPYFHFNETLFKPFENLVCLELCDTDIQDQIVSSICEFVETSTSDIGSGWRSLFGTLKAVRFDVAPSGNRQLHLRAVLDVFDAFLATAADPRVFANAALDFVSCLVHHVRGGSGKDGDDDEEYCYVSIEGDSHNLSSAALCLLCQCNDLLHRMFRMSSCPPFAVAHRVRIVPSLAVVDPVIPEYELRSFDTATDTLPEFPYSFRPLQTADETSEHAFLAKDRSKGLLRVWYLLFDGLTSALTNCPREHQSAAVGALFEMLSSLQAEEDLRHFGLYCTNHLLLPALQSWLRRSQRTFQGWLNSGPNFKHCVGRTTEFVLTWQKEDDKDDHSASLALKQLLLILVECATVPVEGIARLGCSCLRHVVVMGGARLGRCQWDVLCLALCRAAQQTLYPLHQLMAPFYQGSSNFYGDLGDVKVAARRDSCKRETHRLMQLAQQVLLLDRQRPELPAFPENPNMEERSFLFLLHPPTATVLGDEALLRVPVRSLLTGITAHHVLLQLLGSILLQGTKHVVPSLANLLLHGSIMPPLTPCCEFAPLPGSASDAEGNGSTDKQQQLPGMLHRLTKDQVYMLLCGLRGSYQSSLEFDGRPGLKFLVQKVAQLSNAANLYKQAGAAWSLTAIALFDLCLARITSDADVDATYIKLLLEKQRRGKNTQQYASMRDAEVTKDGGDDDGAASQLLRHDGFFVELHDLFLDLCELYVDIIVDKDGHHSKLDEMSKQQLYFLTVEPDDFHEFTKKPPSSLPSDKHAASSDSHKSKSSTSSVSSAKSNEREDAVKKPASPQSPSRPFQFSDFATSQPFRPESPNVSDDSDERVLRKKQTTRSETLEDSALSDRCEPSSFEDEEVFRVTTQAEMDSMMQEYRFRKGKRTLPSISSSKETPPNSAGSGTSHRKNPFLAKPRPTSTSEPVDPEIANQQKASLMADSEARVVVWTELVLVYLHLAADLSDQHFVLFLPLLFPGVKALTAYAKDDQLKQQIADFFQRVASIYGFNPE